MRYATVVVQRLIARALDDWHRRNLEQPAASSQSGRSGRDSQSFLHALLVRLTAHVVAFIRFLAVASPPIDPSTDRPAVTRQARPRLQGAHPIAPHARLRELAAPAATITAPAAPAPGHRAAPAAVAAHPVAVAPVTPATATSSRHAAHPLVAWLGPIVAIVTGGSRHPAEDAGHGGSRPSMSWAAQQRVLGGAVAMLVLVASIVGVSPVHTPTGGTGNVLGAGNAPRTVVGGGSAGSATGEVGGQQGSTTDPATTGTGDNAAYTGTQSQQQVASYVDPAGNQPSIEGFSDNPGSGPESFQRPSDQAATVITDPGVVGAYLPDGTILKPIAVDTTAPDARTLLTRYKVRKGDTLTSIAHSFGLSLQTLYWANHLTTNLKTQKDLKVGQVLSVPPVNGVLHIVTDNETLQDIAKRTSVSVSRIIAANGLKQPTVFVGQWIIIPGAKSKPVPVPTVKPVVKPAARPASSSSSTSQSVSRPAPKPVTRPTYTGGGWAWPAPGGFISQYFHYGHWAIDIADTWGAPVLAAKAGVVIFAGWRNNGGGWQVWISHGNNLYSTYNHMSSLTVGTGQVVAAGRQVGRIGATGDATGPHLHFEVWIGPIWAGGTRQNPLNYV